MGERLEEVAKELSEPSGLERGCKGSQRGKPASVRDVQREAPKLSRWEAEEPPALETGSNWRV